LKSPREEGETEMGRRTAVLVYVEGSMLMALLLWLEGWEEGGEVTVSVAAAAAAAEEEDDDDEACVMVATLLHRMERW